MDIGLCAPYVLEVCRVGPSAVKVTMEQTATLGPGQGRFRRRSSTVYLDGLLLGKGQPQLDAYVLAGVAVKLEG
jgi:hypothetical protein